MEPFPSVTNKKFSKWRSMDPHLFDSAVSMLDKLITDDAKKYYRNLDEIPAVAIMMETFGNQIPWNWKLQEFDGPKRMSTYDFAYNNSDGTLKATLICEAFYRHLRNQFFNLQLAKDSMISKYGWLKSEKSVGLINSGLLEKEQLRIINDFRFYHWEINDTLTGAIFPGNLNYASCTYKGKLVSKDTSKMELGIRITSLVCQKRRKRLPIVLDYSVGKIVFERPISLGNLNIKGFLE